MLEQSEFLMISDGHEIMLTSSVCLSISKVSKANLIFFKRGDNKHIGIVWNVYFCACAVLSSSSGGLKTCYICIVSDQYLGGVLSNQA